MISGGHPFFLRAPDWSTPIQNMFNRDTQVFRDTGFSISWTYFDQARLGFKAEYLLTDRTAIRAVEDFFDARQGRLGAFWVPSWQADLRVTAPIEVGDRDITVANFDYGDYWGGDLVSGRFIHFYTPSGESYVYGIRGISDTVVRVDEPYGVGFDCPEEHLGALLTSYLYLVRFDQDKLDISHIARGFTKFSIDIVQVQE